MKYLPDTHRAYHVFDAKSGVMLRHVLEVDTDAKTFTQAVTKDGRVLIKGDKIDTTTRPFTRLREIAVNLWSERHNIVLLDADPDHLDKYDSRWLETVLPVVSPSSFERRV